MLHSNGMDCLLAKDPSGSSSDDGGFLRDGAEEGAGDSGHTLPVRSSRSVLSHELLLTFYLHFARRR